MATFLKLLLRITALFGLVYKGFADSAPVLCASNFNEQILVSVDEFVNLTVQTITNSSPYFNWSRPNANLPDDSHIINYFKDGSYYTSLIIDKASYSNDGGIYTLSATNHYGTSNISVNVDIYKDIQCFPDNESAPVLSSSGNQTTVEGEIITYKCTFGDNYSQVNYLTSWVITLENGSDITIQDCVNYTDCHMCAYQDCMKYTDYHVCTHQHCPSNNYSCCQFITKLTICASLSLNKARVTCKTVINQMESSSMSYLTVLPQPMLVHGPNNIQVETHETAHFECLYNSSPDLTFCEWRKDNDVLTVSAKYQYSPKARSDPVDPNNVTCSLDVLNVSMDDVGNYFCIAYYNKTYGSMERRVQSNPGEAELKLADTNSNDSSSNSDDLPKVLGGTGGVVGSIITVVVLIIVYVKKKKLWDYIKNLCQRKGDSDSVSREPLVSEASSRGGQDRVRPYGTVGEGPYDGEERDGVPQQDGEELDGVPQRDGTRGGGHCQDGTSDANSSFMDQKGNLNIIATDHGRVNVENVNVYSSRKAGGVLSGQSLEDQITNPLRQHATDFKQLVDIKVLSLVLFENNLLMQQDMEYLLLPTITESQKVDYVYLKMVRLGEEDYKKFLRCLKDPYAMQHDGHTRLHKILLMSQK